MMRPITRGFLQIITTLIDKVTAIVIGIHIFQLNFNFGFDPPSFTSGFPFTLQGNSDAVEGTYLSRQDMDISRTAFWWLTWNSSASFPWSCLGFCQRSYSYGGHCKDSSNTVTWYGYHTCTDQWIWRSIGKGIGWLTDELDWEESPRNLESDRPSCYSQDHCWKDTRSTTITRMLEYMSNDFDNSSSYYIISSACIWLKSGSGPSRP